MFLLQVQIVVVRLSQVYVLIYTSLLVTVANMQDEGYVLILLLIVPKHLQELEGGLVLTLM